jgi:exonuclease III
LLLLEEPLALMGDIDVIPAPDDCYDLKAWEMDGLFQPESRAALRRIEYPGYADAVRARHSETQGPAALRGPLPHPSAEEESGGRTHSLE